MSRKRLWTHADSSARIVLLAPTIVIVLFLSIFPLIVSLFLSFARVSFARGGIDVAFVGLANYEKLLFGSQQRHLIGKLGEMSPLGWIVFFSFTALLLLWFYRELRTGKVRLWTLLLRALAVSFAAGLMWITASTLSGEGLPGTIVVTLIFVSVSVLVQYVIGLGLALILVQNLPGKRFFRVAILLPMMITPVGIAFLFRMLTDTHVGPFAPVWTGLGLQDFSFLQNAAGARVAVIIGDIWQWTPFMFIILLAALEGTSRDQIEAALVDGATRLQMLRFVILPQVATVSLTLILIRLIEGFKIIDIPRILTGGGPGTATESLTLHAYIEWRSPNLGGASAISYVLLILVTFIAMMFVNVVRQKVVEQL
jgi:multiple sugar transport system permease protein